MLKHHWVSVESNECSVRLDFWVDVLAMSAGTNSAINDGKARRELKEVHHFAKHDRSMNRSRVAIASRHK